jgi:hypothetical protein
MKLHGIKVEVGLSFLSTGLNGKNKIQDLFGETSRDIATYQNASLRITEVGEKKGLEFLLVRFWV